MLPVRVSARARSGRSVFFSAWLLLSAISTAWALATPLAASPDEPAHLIKAASVVRGEFLGYPGSDPSRTIVNVPTGISEAWSWTCVARDTAVSASCIPPIPDGLELREAETTAGLYNPVYYALVGWPSLFVADTEMAVFAMRIVSGVLTSLFLAFTFVIVIRLAPPMIAGIAFFAGMTPMVFFLAGSLNPNSLEIATVSALFVGLLHVCFGAGPGINRWVLAVTAAAGVLLANCRGISPLWMAEAGLIVLIVAPKGRLAALIRTRRVAVTLAVMGIGLAFALAWVATTGSLQSLGKFPGAGETTPAEAFVVMLLLRSADPGIIGVFGWLDTYPPSLVYLIWSVLLGAVGFAGIVFARGRWLRGVIFAFAAVILSPPLVQAAAVGNSGYIWQGRYSIAIVVVAVLIAAIAAGSTLGRRAELRGHPVFTLVIVVAVLAVSGQVMAFATTLARYASPGLGSALEAFSAPQWTPPGGGVLLVSVLGVAMALLMALWFVIVIERAKAEEPLRELRVSQARTVTDPKIA